MNEETSKMLMFIGALIVGIVGSFIVAFLSGKKQSSICRPVGYHAKRRGMSRYR